jgi:hypothetical protein
MADVSPERRIRLRAPLYRFRRLREPISPNCGFHFIHAKMEDFFYFPYQRICRNADL